MLAFWKLTVTELKLFVRDPLAVFFILAFPLILLWLNAGRGGVALLVPGYVALVLATVGHPAPRRAGNLPGARHPAPARHHPGPSGHGARRPTGRLPRRRRRRRGVTAGDRDRVLRPAPAAGGRGRRARLRGRSPLPCARSGSS